MSKSHKKSTTVLVAGKEPPAPSGKPVKPKKPLPTQKEAGADAMLKALLKDGQHFTKENIEKGYEVSHWFPPTDGTWVYIPDDKGGE